MLTKKEFGVITTDNNLNVISWNNWIEKACNKILTKGEKLTTLFPEIVERGLDKKISETLNSNTITILSATFHKYLIKCKPLYSSKIFNEMQQSVTISPLHDGTKKIGLIIVIKDVTEETENAKTEKIILEDKTSELFVNLSNENWKKRKEASEEISHNHESLINEIVSRIKNEHKNLNVLNSALQVLINTPSEVVEILIELLSSEDPDLRIYAAQTMGDKNDKAFIEPLIKALDDPNQNVKYHAIESLGKLKAIQATNKILEFALQKDFFISFPAIDALKNIGDSNLAVKLLPLLKDEIFNTIVIETIGKIGDEKIIADLCNIINENLKLTFTVCNSLIEIYNRFQSTYEEGELIIQKIKNYINDNGIKNIVNSISIIGNDPKKIIVLSKVLGWLEGNEVEKTLATLIHNDNVRDLVLESLVKLGNKIAPLLHSQINIADSNTKCAIITVLGRIGNKESVPFLIESLDEYDEKICVTTLGALAKIGDRNAFIPILNLLGSYNQLIRRAAISALNSIGHPEMENYIFKLINDKNPLVRESAIKIAGYFGYPKTKELVFKSCSDEDENVRVAALENLPFFDDERVINILNNSLKVETQKCKIAAIKALAHTEDKHAIELLLKSLKDNDPWIKINAIRSLVFHNYYEAEEIFIKLALNENSIPVKITALEALGDIGKDSSVIVLTKFISDENKDISSAAIKSLGKIKSNEAINPLLNLLKSHDETNKLLAIEVLSNKNNDEIIEALSWVASTDNNFNVKIKAIESLSNIGSKKSIDTLIKLTADKEIREFAIKGLSKQKIQNIFFIAQGLENKNNTIKTAIIEALCRMKNNAASEIIYTCLDDEDPDIKIIAIQALDKIGNRTQEKKIAQLALNDPDERVRFVANEFLKINN
ncbi:MAG: HEAT repeat domain-containing protein [Melioribacteraceae bacterium]|nr:HEAT repeat domain-containing protein [Melioribacteraceae bacterium]